MSEQINKSIPKETIIAVETCIGENVTDARFQKAYRDKGRNKLNIEEFVVNNKFVVRIADGKYFLGYDTIENDEKAKKAFGDRVRRFMKETNTPWEIAKLVANEYPDGNSTYSFLQDEKAIRILHALKQAKDILDESEEWREKIQKDRYYMNSLLCTRTNKGYNYGDLNFSVRKTRTTVKKYWLGK